MLEITATYLRERFRFANDGTDDVVIAEAQLTESIDGYEPGDVITVKGPASPDELQPEQSYRFYGHWTSYKNRRTGQTEKQLAFSTFTRTEPAGRAGVIAYLQQAGTSRGIGKARAAKLWEFYGSDAVRVLREQPEEVAAKIRGLSLQEATEASAWLQQQRDLEACTIAVTNLLAGRGFPKKTTRSAIQEWGNRAAELIRRDPCRLMAFRGCGYKRCDDLYLSLGLPPSKLRRQAYSIWYTLARDTDGHTWFPLDFAFHGLRDLVRRDAQPERALKLAQRIARLLPDRHGAVAVCQSRGDAIVSEGGQVWVAEGRKANAEERLAELVADAISEPCDWPDVDEIDGISDHQREQLRLALAGPIAILGGRPGTGKTFSTARLVRLLIEQFGEGSIAIAAPTGKAAVRITEVMAGYGVPLRARTWHSLLGVEQASQGEGWSFKHNESNPLPYRVLIGDETSMIDTPLMCSIFRARAAGTHVLLVGDVNQLPPVGHGAPLRDMIAAGLPYGELREIKRNSGGIVETCAAIVDDQPWSAGGNLAIHDVQPESVQVRYLLAELDAIREAGGDPIWDAQILVAVNKKSKLSRQELNKILQAELNRRGGVEGSPFRESDKIVNTKNGFFPLVERSEGDDETQVNEKGEAFVANGELARVLAVEPGCVIAELSSPARTIRIPRGKTQDSQDDGDGDDSDKTSTGCSWDLGYAISCHKSQGSEWPTVIVMVDDYPGARMVCDRAWLYTAISRAKDRCVLIGKKATAERFCRTTKIWQRKTFLKERILLKQSQAILCEM